MPGKPPVLPVVQKTNIPRLFEVTNLKNETYRANYHGEESEMGDNIYGGLLFAQGLEAAQLDVGDEYLPTAYHSLFVSYSYSHLPVDYKVEKLRNGKSFCARSVKGTQENGEVVFAAMANFSKASEATVQHTTSMPKVKSPDELVDFFDFCEQNLTAINDGKLQVRPSVKANFERRLFDKPHSVLDIRPLNPEQTFMMQKFGVQEPMRYWLKSSVKLGDDPKLHRQLLCYISDMYLVGAAVYPHISVGAQASLIASLDNTIWFHRYDFRADEWLLYETFSPAADSGRGISHGKIWTRDGTLIASTAQEILARFKGNSKL
ncbi:Acyl-coenzyme A thioesterase 8 [Aphelenchoides besseyi]|nr:Acyl-coenzyme A thioesterase 8 [Aphelenchoides besseyi]